MTNQTNEVADALAEGKQGCTLCALWSRDEDSMVSMIAKDGAPTNSELREKIVSATGFCNRHTYVIERAGTKGNESFGSSASAQLVLKKIEDDLTSLLGEIKSSAAKEQLGSVIGKLERSLYGQSICPVCDKLLRADKERMSALLRMLETKDFAARFERSDVVCFPHFVSLMRLIPSSGVKDPGAVWSLVVRAELVRMGAVDKILNERMEKYSWDHRSEGITQQEAGAQNLGKLIIAGVEGLYCRPRKTSLRPAREP